MTSEEEEVKQKNKVKKSFKWFTKHLKGLMRLTFTINDDADIEGTIDTIKKDSVFKGHRIWILVFSIMIASIGLNTNSPAVVIGAMLISPLMGPILGIGLTLGTNDIKHFFVALRSLLIMITIGIATSYLYFSITPFNDAQSELIARTKPQLLDALIAIFGGLAGIIGNSRSERGNVIPGVAIATALMPPLCTAGFGLAIENYEYFLQAFYLFLLNSAFICITCFAVVKIMGFPVIHFDPKKEKKVRFFLFIVAIVVIIPSCFVFLSLIEEKKFKKGVDAFLANEMSFKETYLFKHEVLYNQKEGSTLSLYMIGETLSEEQRDQLNTNVKNYGLGKINLIIKQRKDNRKFFEQEVEQITTTKEEYRQKWEQAQKTVAFQEDQIAKLKAEIEKRKLDTIPTGVLTSELKTLYPEIENMALGKTIVPKDSIYSSLHLAYINWSKKDRSSRYSKSKKLANIREWIKLKLHADSVLVQGMN